jgi:hypothetical protein
MERRTYDCTLRPGLTAKPKLAQSMTGMVFCGPDFSVLPHLSGEQVFGATARHLPLSNELEYACEVSYERL